MEAEKLSRRLQDIEFDAIYSSPLGRAKQTAEILRAERNLPIHLLDGLQEMNFGIWEGTVKAELTPEMQIRREILFTEPQYYLPPTGGQTFSEFFAQVRQCAAYLLEQSRQRNILAVTHGMWITSFHYLHKQKEMADFWEIPFVGNTALSIIEMIEGEVRILLEKDTSHLQVQIPTIFI